MNWSAVGSRHCDYILSGIPFSILEINKKRALAPENVRRAQATAAASLFIR